MSFLLINYANKLWFTFFVLQPPFTPALTIWSWPPYVWEKQWPLWGTGSPYPSSRVSGSMLRLGTYSQLYSEKKVQTWTSEQQEHLLEEKRWACWTSTTAYERSSPSDHSHTLQWEQWTSGWSNQTSFSCKVSHPALKPWKTVNSSQHSFGLH